MHDGSQCRHRAYEAAAHLARRSLASLDLIGIYGTVDATGEPSLLGDDYEWQKGWLTRLVEMYATQASAEGIAFNWKLFPANDPCGLLDTLHRMEVDLIVLPVNLSRSGLTASGCCLPSSAAATPMCWFVRS